MIVQKTTRRLQRRHTYVHCSLLNVFQTIFVPVHVCVAYQSKRVNLNFKKRRKKTSPRYIRQNTRACKEISEIFYKISIRPTCKVRDRFK